MSINSVCDLEEQVENLCGELFEQTEAHQVTYEMAKAALMDYRAFSSGMYFSEQFIAVGASGASALNYYGAFEYVDAEYVRKIGPYVFYLADDGRVSETIEALRAAMQGDEVDED